MSTKKVTKTDESSLIAEVTENSQELSRKEIIAQMRANALSRYAEIQGDVQGLEQLGEDKRHQRRLLIEQRDQADDHHQSMAREEVEAAARVARESSRLEIAKGTQAEAEHQAILQSLIADLDQCKKRTEEASTARDESYKRAELINALDNAIDEIQGQLIGLAQEAREMQDLAQEQHRLYGEAVRDEIRAGIEEARLRKDQGRRYMQAAEEDEASLQSRIARELKAWPDLQDGLHFTHGARKTGPLTDIEHIREAHAKYIEALRDHGRFIGSRGHVERQQFCNQLDLNPGFTLGVMLGGDFEIATKQRLELIRTLR